MRLNQELLNFETMPEHLHNEPIFRAPLMPGSRSLLQQYHMISRWASLPILLAAIMLIAWLSTQMTLGIWLIVALAVPLNFILMHSFILGLLRKFDNKLWHKKSISMYEDMLTIQDGDQFLDFELERMSNIKLIYSGHERAFLPQGRYFNGANNQLSFTYGNQQYEFRFRLVSRGHYHALLELMEYWYNCQQDFEEYNQSTGLAVKSNMLELN